MSSYDTYILNGPVTAFFVGVGLILNLQTIYILMRPIRRSFTASALRSGFSVKSGISHTSGSFVRSQNASPRPLIYTYLLWLSASDTALLISAFFMYCYPSFLTILGIYTKFFPLFYMVSNASLTASVWLMCVLMFERYRALCRPLVTKAMSVTRVHKILAAVVLLSIVFSAPRLFELEVDDVEVNGTSTYHLSQTNLVDDRIYIMGYRIIGGLIFYSLFPYIVLFALTAKISLALRAAAKERQAMATSLTAKSGRKISDCEMILLAVMAKFLFSRLMPTALDVAEHIVTADVFVNSPVATLVVAISNLLVVVSSAINFFIYFALSRSFRRSACIGCTNLLRKAQDSRDLELPGENNKPLNSLSPAVKHDNSEHFHSSFPLIGADAASRKTEYMV